MPRISVCTNYDERSNQNFSAENDNLDFCRSCYKTVNLFTLAASHGVTGDVNEATELDAEHFSYGDDEEYGLDPRCEKCNRKLTERDD